MGEEQGWRKVGKERSAEHKGQPRLFSAPQSHGGAIGCTTLRAHPI